MHSRRNCNKTVKHTHQFHRESTNIRGHAGSRNTISRNVPTPTRPSADLDIRVCARANVSVCPCVCVCVRCFFCYCDHGAHSPPPRLVCFLCASEIVAAQYRSQLAINSPSAFSTSAPSRRPRIGFVAHTPPHHETALKSLDLESIDAKRASVQHFVVTPKTHPHQFDH